MKQTRKREHRQPSSVSVGKDHWICTVKTNLASWPASDRRPSSLSSRCRGHRYTPPCLAFLWGPQHFTNWGIPLALPVTRSVSFAAWSICIGFCRSGLLRRWLMIQDPNNPTHSAFPSPLSLYSLALGMESRALHLLGCSHRRAPPAASSPLYRGVALFLFTACSWEMMPLASQP